MTDCPPADVWTQWLADVLSDHARLRCDEHVEECATCRGVLDRLTGWSPWTSLDAWPALRTREATTACPGIPGFENLTEVGRGGHGVVYRALQTGLGRPVAVKLLRYGPATSPDERRRFRREAESLALLQHPNIVRVFGSGEWEGLPYFFMEWEPGGCLADRLDGTPWTQRDAAELVKTLARAVHSAHEAGVIHRDLKPANVLLGGDGMPKLSDFGIAKLQDGPTAATPTMAVLGTPGYMAPEQASGLSRLVGPATDVYSLGTILYELLTGRPPFGGESTFETLMQVREQPPVPPRQLRPRLDRDLETICLHCLRKEPARRYATADALAIDLRRYLDRLPIVARPPGLGERVRLWVMRRPSQAVLALVLLVAITGATGAGFWTRSRLNATRAEERAAGLVSSLAVADPAQVPRLLDDISGVQATVLPRIYDAHAAAPRESRAALNLALALAAVDESHVDELRARSFAAAPEEVLLIRDALAVYAGRLAPDLWRELELPDNATGRRLRAAAMLAGLDPESGRWAGSANVTAAALVRENPIHIGGWARAFQPVCARLVDPLRKRFIVTDAAESERLIAATLLANFASHDPVRLSELLLHADAKSFDLLCSAVACAPAGAVPRLQAELAAPVADDSPDEDAEAAARRRANAVIALARLGDRNALWKSLRHRPDPGLRSQIVHRLGRYGVEVREVARRLVQEPDVSARRALVLCLGEYPPDAIPPADRQDVKGRLLTVYRDDPDPGLHAAIDWLLRRRWSAAAELDAIVFERTGRPPEGRDWFVSRGGDTFAIIRGPHEFWMGSRHPNRQRFAFEDLHRHRIRHTYAIGLQEVTIDQFRQFQVVHPDVEFPLAQVGLQEANEPVRNVRWHDAARYCHWRSVHESLPDGEMVYPSHQEIAPGMTLRAGYLSRMGYRLPTNAEWENACRAGATSTRLYGSDKELLSQYAWHIASSQDRTWPVGMLKPNDLGLFDVLGNVWEFTQPCPVRLAGVTMDAELRVDDDGADLWFNPDGTQFTVHSRGGSYLYHWSFVTCSRHYGTYPSYRDRTMGFRLAMTLPNEKP